MLKSTPESTVASQQPADRHQVLPHTVNRRSFVQTLACGTCAVALGRSIVMADQPGTPWLRKTLKVGMIKGNMPLAEKFAIAKQAGFEGVELSVPGIDVDEAKAAAKSSGLIIDGTVGSYHWNIRHSDPDPDVRASALEKLKQGIQETAAVGADTMLLVPAHGRDGSDAEVYERAFASIQEALPVAEKHGVSILIENVWNDFLYEHDGPDNQTADALAKFIDAFESPWMGVQFDIGNHWKYGDPAAWIRTLGPRIKKLDIKGFSRETGGFTKITEGDIDWASVETALQDIGFTGWLAAEVAGGDLERLREVSDHMEESLHCSKSLSSAS
ncbi:Xylose isomerase-like TIM barrel [Rubripirellula lacrimiformis]|uniref:Xylose isomerase-like TIM barrel n=1 Tax=Rubripirellula lacrimiformis TaxID=1930273 RepID=A0A517NG81_9BACT|nr:sugar phosphate isomerase/epimerase family protein [Rubripirellula lacrimiformis]QDT06131.1 Xylose isomerase-like TIM barrel [Rubripirellula lacrimiformis]